MAGKGSPVEAVRYTDALHARKKSRRVRGAKVHQMAFANLGRNKSKTLLVVLSLAYLQLFYQALVQSLCLQHAGLTPIRMKKDSGQEIKPVFYLFDTPDAQAEAGTIPSTGSSVKRSDFLL